MLQSSLQPFQQTLMAVIRKVSCVLHRLCLDYPVSFQLKCHTVYNKILTKQKFFQTYLPLYCRNFHQCGKGHHILNVIINTGQKICAIKISPIRAEGENFSAYGIMRCLPNAQYYPRDPVAATHTYLQKYAVHTCENIKLMVNHSHGCTLSHIMGHPTVSS